MMVQEVINRGVTLVVSAYGSSHSQYANIPGVINVAMLLNTLEYVVYHNTQSQELNVDIGAPVRGTNGNGDIWRLEENNGCRASYGGGSSAAAPHVAGTVALMLAVNPCLKPAEIENILKKTAKPIPNADEPGDPWYNLINAGSLNAYQAVLMAKIKSGTSVTSDETWDDYRLYNGDVIIKSGATLTISGTVKFDGQNSKIIVEPGGKLIVNEGVLSVGCEKDYWGGIEVLGTPNASQFSASQHGIVELYDALIEYAVTGVSLYNRHNYDSGGGILKAENSTFSNCQRAIGAAKYENFLPSTPPRPFYNLSYIKNCVFTLNDDFPFASFWGHILFDRIRGINVSGSKLEDSRTTVSTEALLGAGINGYDSRYTVSSTTFENLRFGINAQNVSSVNTFTVRGSSFTNNHIGVNVRAVNNFTVAENCQFTVGGFAFDDQLTSLSDPDLHLGVFIDQSTGFTVKENTFTGDNSSGNIPIGVGAKNTNFIAGEGITLDQNEIFKNTFQDLEVANLANNFNTGNQVIGGLVYVCNENNVPNKSNVVDVAVVGSIGVNQVAENSKSVSNKFSHLGGDPSFSDINNLEGNDINYFYYGPGSVEDPIYSPPVKVNKFLGNTNTCSSTIEDDEISDQDLPGVVSGFDTRWQAYKNAKAAYIGLMDGGDQQATLSLVNGATVFNMSSVKAQLLGYAPYLSGAVIEAIIDHQVFPSTDKSDLLAANPEVIRKSAMWSYIENSGAFSSQQLLTLEQAAQQTTARTTTERNLASAYGDMQRSAKRLIRHYRSDSTSLKLDSIRYYLDAKLSLESAFDQVESWLQEDNTSAADNFLQSITTNFSLNTTQLAEFNYYNDLKQLCIDLLDSNRDYADLTSNELTLVQNIAGNSTGLASVQAQNLLNRAYGGTYQHEPILPQGTGQLSRPEVDATIPTASFQPVVNVTAIPNPARDQVRFDFESIQPLSKAQLVISDINGSVVFNVALAEDATHYLWNTSALTQGIYFYRLLSEQGESATHKLVIIR